MTTSSVRARALVVGGALVLALAACGSDPDASAAPTNAPIDTFCAEVGDLDTSDVDALVDALLETGTPKGIPDDARAGFEVMIEKADQDEISSADQDKVTAFVGYVAATCAAPGGDGS